MGLSAPHTLQNIAVSQGNDLHPGPLKAWAMLRHARADAPCPGTAGPTGLVQSQAFYKDYNTLTNSQSVLFINTNRKPLLIKHVDRMMINR